MSVSVETPGLVELVLSRDLAFQAPALTWKPLRKADGSRSALIVCRRGHAGTITNHEIGIDGTVYPSVVCATEGCDFHEFIRLVGWVPE